MFAGTDIHPHRRKNPLTNEWVILSPQRAARPWQGKKEKPAVNDDTEHFDSSCYLCPGNTRAKGVKNPSYTGTFVFENDFPAMFSHDSQIDIKAPGSELFSQEPVKGVCRVVCFSERHDLTLAEMEKPQIIDVINIWKAQAEELGKLYQWVQIFENKGKIMGCSNSHPHGQIWASNFIPLEPEKEDNGQNAYFSKNKRVLLLDYLEQELEKNERIVYENETWAALVPFWAIWPFELVVIPKAHTQKICELKSRQITGLADVIKRILVQYDNLFATSFPYSMGWHGAPDRQGDFSYWQLHAHYYPPLLRSAAVKKFMVGYEMLCSPQRDMTPETAAAMIKNQPVIHYKKSGDIKK